MLWCSLCYMVLAWVMYVLWRHSLFYFSNSCLVMLGRLSNVAASCCWSAPVSTCQQCVVLIMVISKFDPCRHHHHQSYHHYDVNIRDVTSQLLWCSFGENDGNLSTINCRWQESEIESVLVHESPIIGFHPQHPSAGTTLEVCWDFNCVYLNSPSVLDEGYNVFLCPAVTMLLALIGIAWWWLRLPTSSTAQWHRKEL